MHKINLENRFGLVFNTISSV